jgi:hypothetical protein
MPATDVGIAAVINRRTVVEAGSAAVAASGCGVYGSPAGQRREINGATQGPASRRLSVVFCRNAAGFYRVAVVRQGRFPENSLYSLAIAIELSLKGYLLHRGVSDDWNRTHLRHDLHRALVYAERLGFRRAPDGLAGLAACLTPYYERHAIGWPELEPRAHDIVGDLLRGVAGQIHQETANGFWAVRLRLGRGHA